MTADVPIDFRGVELVLCQVEYQYTDGVAHTTESETDLGERLLDMGLTTAFFVRDESLVEIVNQWLNSTV